MAAKRKPELDSLVNRDQRPVSWRHLLAACPHQNRAARLEWLPNGGLRLTVRKHRPWFLAPPLTWFIHPRLTRAYELDRLGAYLWKACDGQRRVEAIIDEFAARHRLSFHEARVAVTGYLQELTRRGAVAVVLDDRELAPADLVPAAAAGRAG